MPQKNASYTFRGERIFSDGVFLVPMVITKEDGTTVLMWVVESFSDDAESFKDGYPINPQASADNIDELIGADDDDDDD